MKLTHTIHQAQDGFPVVTVLRHDFRLSSAMIKRLKQTGGILVNDKAARTCDRVYCGDLVCAELPNTVVNPIIKPDYEPVEVLYEDDCFVALSKPQGIVVHPTAAKVTGTLANRLLGYLQNTGQTPCLHIVTRLDRDTGGIVLFAKNPHIHSLMMRQLGHGSVIKEYEALVAGQPKKRGRIELAISRPDPASMKRAPDPGGAMAVTDYETVKRYEVFGQSVCLMRLFPQTGRTHQLRVHCQSMGFPILGDPLYGTGESLWLSGELGVSRQQLFAKRLRFSHPVTERPVDILMN